jgi:hypothetical protein
MYYTGIDPFTKKPVHVARHLRDRKLQRALMQFFKPENYLEVRKALLMAGRRDLIGHGCDALIPAEPPREVLERRRVDANKRFDGDYVHARPDAEKRKRSRKRSRHESTTGYRPERKSTA